MEIILAIVVAAAVVFFGALISMGNERQRRAIDELREQVVMWAVQDLKIKRKHLIQTVQVLDPLNWLSRTASQVCGYDLELHVIEKFEDQQFLVCDSSDGAVRVIFSPFSPADIRKIKKNKRSRLSRVGSQYFFSLLSNSMDTYEMSVLNCGVLFDVELSIAWKQLTGQELIKDGQFWIYVNFQNRMI